MEEDILQRIRALLRTKGVSMLQVSDAYGIKQNTFSRQISGESALSALTLLSIIGYFPDVNTEWLLRGEGSMLKQEVEGTQEEKQKVEMTFYVDENGFLKLKK